jgi:hypothetical protein
MADTQNDNQGQQPTGGSPIGPPQPIRVPNVGLIRRIFDRGTQDGTIQSGPVSPARKVQPLLTGVTSEAQPKPLSLQGAGMEKPRKAIVQPKPKLVGKVEKGTAVQPIAVPEVSDIQSFAPQRQLTEAEIEQNRAKYVPEAIENTIIIARNSASDKTYFDNFVSPNLRKTLSEDIKSGELDAGLNKDRYPIVTRRVDGVFENTLQGAIDRGNTLIGLDEYDRLDDKGLIQFLSGKSTLRMPTLSQVGSPTKDLYSGQTTEKYQGAVPIERGTIGEIAYGVGGVLPDIATGIVTAPLNMLVPGASLASVAAIQGRTGRINAAQQAFQVAKTNGLNDEEALQIAKNAEKTGAVTGALEGAASQFFGTKILKAFAAPTAKTALTGFVKQAKQFAKGAITTTGKAALPLAADMGVAGTMEIVRQEALADQNLENPNRNKEILDNVKMEGAVGLAFAIVGKLSKVPKYLQSYATSALATLDPNDLVDYATEMELRGEAPAGFTDTVREEVKKYNDAKSAAGDVVDADIEPTVVGLIMKKKNLQEKLKEADDTIKPQIQAQIDELNTRITTTLDTKVPQEVDDKTQSKIEQDATKENEQVTTVQEGGTTEPTGVIPGQQEVGQGEGSQRQATEQGTNISDSNIGSQAEVDPVEELRKQEQAEYDSMTDPNDEVKKQEIYDRYDKLITPLLKNQEANKTEVAKIKRAGDSIRALKINQPGNPVLQANVFGIPIAIYDGLIEVAATAYETGADVVNAIRKYLAEQSPEDISGVEEDALIENIKSEVEKIKSNKKTTAETTRIPTEEEVLAHAAKRKERQQKQIKAGRTVNQTEWRKLSKAFTENQFNVIKEIRKTGKFSDLLVAALEEIRQTSVDSNERIEAFNKNVYEGLSDKPTIKLGNYQFSEKGLLEEVIRVKRLIEIQRMLGDKFARFQQFDAEYNNALAEYEAIDGATAKNKKKLDKVAQKINEINKKIVEANSGKQNIAEDDYLEEGNKDSFRVLVDAVRVEHEKADKIMSDIESMSEEIKAATAKVRESRNKRQKSLEYIANRGVLAQNQDGTYALGNYKMEDINGVPYTANEAQTFLNAASRYDKFADIDARSEEAFSAFKSVLDEQYNAGLIPQEVYDDLSQYKYVPIRYITKMLSGEMSPFTQPKGGNTIKSLTGGSDGATITDYSALFNVYVSTALRNIKSNNFLQLLDTAIKSELPEASNNSIFNQDVLIKVAETEKNDDGTDKTDKLGNKVYKELDPKNENIRVRYKDGDTMLTVPEWLAKEFYQSSKTDKWINIASTLLGVKTIRYFSTIANAAFGIAQLSVLDPLQAVLTARGINPILPVGYAQIVFDWKSTAKSIINKDAIYKEAVKNGVFGDIAIMSGMDKFYDNKIFTGIEYIDGKTSNQNIFSKYGSPLEIFGVKQVLGGVKSTLELSQSIVSATEKMTRLIVYKKSKKYFIDKGYSNEEAGKLAASESRNTANFSRVGDIIKTANNFIPYLSATVAVKRAVIKSFQKAPVRTSFVMAQMASSAMYVTLWSMGALSDDEKEKEYWGEMYKALPDYYKKNYVIIRNPFHEVGDGVTNAFNKIGPLPFLAKEMYTGFINYKMRDYMDEPIESDNVLVPIVASVARALDMPGVSDVSVPPTINALSKAFLNIDPFTGYKIVPDESTEGFSYLEKKEGTMPFIQAAAETVGISGPKTQSVIQSFTGDFNRNFITQITANALNLAYEAAAGKEKSILKSIKEDPYNLIKGSFSSVTSRFYATPKKYYINNINNLKMDFHLLTTIIGGNDVMQNLIKSRKESVPNFSSITTEKLKDSIADDFKKLLVQIEKDLGKDEAQKYKKIALSSMSNDVIETVVKNITKDPSIIRLSRERNPLIRGRRAYDLIKDAESDQKQSEIFGILGAIEFFKDTRTFNGYAERAIEDNFGSEYVKPYNESLIKLKSSIIGEMYSNSKEFNYDSKEVKKQKLNFIKSLEYMESIEYDKNTINGDSIKKQIFGFQKGSSKY